MGWRVGFLAFDATTSIGDQLMKVQDTIPICATIIRYVIGARRDELLKM